MRPSDKKELLIILAVLACIALGVGCFFLSVMVHLSGDPLTISTAREFQSAMKEDHPSIQRITMYEVRSTLDVTVLLSSQEEAWAIHDEVVAFFSGEEFLSQYIPYCIETMPEGVSGVDPPMPDITVHCYLGEREQLLWSCGAMFYVGGYRSDQDMEEDRYQTWGLYDPELEE